jgi:hypothetical protein
LWERVYEGVNAYSIFYILCPLAKLTKGTMIQAKYWKLLLVYSVYTALAGETYQNVSWNPRVAIVSLAACQLTTVWLTKTLFCLYRQLALPGCKVVYQTSYCLAKTVQPHCILASFVCTGS